MQDEEGYLLDLPDLPLSTILVHLPSPRDMASVSQTCKRMAELALK
jgi:hypothetical protein